MYIVCWIDWISLEGNKQWKLFTQEQEMKEFSIALLNSAVEASDVMVFNLESQLPITFEEGVNGP